MTTDAENSMPSAQPAAKRPRGRPAQSATETHQQRIARLQDELRQAQTALKISEDHRASIAGHAVLRYAGHNVEFARHLVAALRSEVKAKVDQAAIRDLLDPDAAPSLPASELPPSTDPVA